MGTYQGLADVGTDRMACVQLRDKGNGGYRSRISWVQIR